MDSTRKRLRARGQIFCLAHARVRKMRKARFLLVHDRVQKAANGLTAFSYENSKLGFFSVLVL